VVRTNEEDPAGQIERRRRAPTDWKAIIAATGLFGSALYFVGQLYSEHLLADMRQLIAEHSAQSSISRAEYFRELESKAGGALDRLGTMETNCATIREWRPTVDRAISELQAANIATLQRIATLESMASSNAAEHARLERRNDRMDDATQQEIDQLQRNQAPDQLQRRIRDIGIKR
jgi:hypothetical protein